MFAVTGGLTAIGAASPAAGSILGPIALAIVVAVGPPLVWAAVVLPGRL